MKKNVLKASLSLLLTGVILAGCDSNTEEPSAGEKTNETVKVVNIWTGATGAPTTFVNENGELDGYDVAVANEVDKRIPEIEFKWNKGEFASLFLGLDADRYQVVVNSIVKNPERLEKYLFSDNTYQINKDVIAVSKDNTDIKSLEDLEGKKVVTMASGTSSQLFIEEYSETHPMELIPTKASVTEQLRGVQQGQYDATVLNEVVIDSYNKEFGDGLKKIALPEEFKEQTEVGIHFLFRKDAEDIQKLVDEALTSMKEDGTLSELSMEYLGADYTK